MDDLAAVNWFHVRRRTGAGGIRRGSPYNFISVCILFPDAFCLRGRCLASAWLIWRRWIGSPCTDRFLAIPSSFLESPFASFHSPRIYVYLWELSVCDNLESRLLFPSMMFYSPQKPLSHAHSSVVDVQTEALVAKPPA